MNSSTNLSSGGLRIGEDGRSDASSCVFVLGKAELRQGLRLGGSVHLLQKLQHLSLSTQSPLYFVHALEEDGSTAKNHGSGVVGERLCRDGFCQLVALGGRTGHPLPPGEIGGCSTFDVKLKASLWRISQTGGPRFQVGLSVLLQPLHCLQHTREVAHQSSQVILEVAELQDKLLIRLLELLELFPLPLRPWHVFVNHLHALLLCHLDPNRELYHVLLSPALHSKVVDVHGSEELLVDVLGGGCRDCN